MISEQFNVSVAMQLYVQGSIVIGSNSWLLKYSQLAKDFKDNIILVTELRMLYSCTYSVRVLILLLLLPAV